MNKCVVSYDDSANLSAAPLPPTIEPNSPVSTFPKKRNLG